MRNKSGGFTLIELLVSMGLSLLVISMIAGVFNSSRINHDVQDEIAQLQENIRISSALFRRVTFHSGHRSVPTSTLRSDASAIGVSVNGTNGTSNVIGSQDNVTISFQGDGMPNAPSGVISDCLGNSVGIGTLAQVLNPPITSNRFEIRNVAGRPWLSCSLDGGTTWAQLVPDVEGLEVTYGVDTNANFNALAFLAADQLGGDFSNVMTLRIALLFRTNRQIASQPDTQIYTLGDQTYGPYNDQRIRRQLTITASVRNAASQ